MKLNLNEIYQFQQKDECKDKRFTQTVERHQKRYQKEY